MKNQKLLLRLGLACLLAMFATVAAYGQSGSSCSSPLSLTASVNQCTSTDKSFPAGETVRWFSFVADSSHIVTTITAPQTAPAANVTNIALFSGSCNNLTLVMEKDVNFDGFMRDTVLSIEERYLTISNTYYLRITQDTTGCSSCDTTAQYFGLCLQNLSEFELAMPTCAAPSWDGCNLVCNGTTDYWVYSGNCINLQPTTWFTPPWQNPGGGVPHNYLFCTSTSAASTAQPHILGATQLCQTGGGYMGLFTYDNGSNYRSYVTQYLTKPLKQGRKYYAEMKVNLGDNSNYDANNIGMLFTPWPVQQVGTGVISGTPQVNRTAILSDKTNFVTVSGCVTGNGDQWLTIGNFYTDANTSVNLNNTGDGPYAYVLIGCIKVYEVPGAGPDSTVRCGNSVTLGDTACNTAGATFSWAPSTGLSCTTCQNPVASPLTTTSYTLTATYNGCTYTDTVTITVNPINVTVSGNQTICEGANVQLTASGASTYSWSPSTGLSNASIGNPIASPTTTTTYTVTGTDSYGCQATATVTVTVDPKPVCTITSNIISACSSTGQFSTTSNSNCTYSWSVSPSATITSGQGTNTANIDFSANTGQNYTVSVVVTNTVTSCQSTCTYLVSQCCSPVDGLTLSNDTSSNYGTLFTGNLGINGVFVIDNNCTFRGVDAQLGYNAKILIQPGASLTITDNSGTTSKLYACNYMWDGIYIDGSTASLTVNKGSSIEDAQNAIVSNNGGVYTIGAAPSNGTVKLNKNYKNIVVNSYSGAHTGTVTGTSITCKDSVTTVTYVSSPAQTLRPPHTGERTYVGIEINSVTNSTALAVGSASSASLKNDFDNMDYGIIATNSNITVKNNEFLNITSPGLSKKNPNCPIGTAICARGNSSLLSNQRTLTVGGSGSNELNMIKDGGVGIDAAVNLHLNVTYNTFTNLSLVGIKAVRNFLRTVTFSNNTFKDAPLGISTYDLRGCNITMSLNSMNMKNKTNAQGIVVSETFPTPLTRYTINHNTIDTVRNGIVGSTLVGSRMDNNTIRLKHTANPNAYGRGIYLSGTQQPYVRSNTIYGENRNDWWAEGVRLDICYADTVACNSTDDLGAGQFFSGSQPFTYFAKNSMTDHLWGLLINSGDIGSQGVSGNPNDNTWNGSFTYSQTHAFFSDGNDSPFLVQSASQYHPTNNTRYPVQNPQNPIPFSSTSGSSSLLCSSPTAGGDLNRAMEIGGIIVADTVVYPAYSDENVWLSKWALFNYIKGDSGMLEEQAIADFYEAADGDNFGKLYDVLEIMGNMDNLTTSTLENAYEINNTIDPQNAIETNWKAVNEILITNAINDSIVPTETQLTDLRLIAQQCPLSDGPAVYIARSILAAYDTSYTEYEDVCEQPDTSTGSGSRLMAQQPLKQGNIKLYPNPNSRDMLLAYELAEGESGELVIFDLTGKQVAQVALAQGQKVMPLKAELTNGVYLYRVTVNGEIRKTGKLVIVR